jgi:hypothetical protein
MDNFADVVAAYDTGQFQITSWRKQPTQTTGSGIWFDLSMSPGNPVPNYYAATPLESKVLARSTDYGINHGPAVSPKRKYLKSLTVISTTATAAPLPMLLCDYLLYYPFVDMSVAGGEYQPMSNIAPLTRYTDGAGVQIMAVEVASQIGSSEFYVTYTNQDGVSGRVTPTVRCNTQVVNGTIITSNSSQVNSAGPFLPLQGTDTGVRLIEGITFLGAGDVGLITLVLVKPLAYHSVQEITAPAERDYILDFPSMPPIQDDAYLNFICHPVGTLASAQITGLAEFIWK